MDKIEDVSIQQCTNSRFIQPYRVKYKQNGQQRFWDCTKMHDSLAVLIFNKTRKAFVLVRQFRPAVYMSKNRPLWENSEVFSTALSQQNPTPAESTPPSLKKAKPEASSDNQSLQFGPGSEGVTYELCAGLIDKSSSLQQIAREEILEETGYDVPLEGIEYVNSYHSSIGTGGTVQTLFYCEVTDEMLVGKGGGNEHEGEMITVIHLTVTEAMQLVFDSSKPRPSALCFAFLWFDKFKRPLLNL